MLGAISLVVVVNDDGGCRPTDRLATRPVPWFCFQRQPNCGIKRIARQGCVDWVETDSDEDAIARVRELKPGAHMCESWQHERLTAKIDSDGGLEIINLET